MKRNIIFAIVFFLLLSACGQPIVYNGDRLPKTMTAELYYSAGEIRRPYKVIGHIKAHKYSDNIMKIDLTHFGRSIGADAVIVVGTEGKYVNADAVKFE